MAPLEELLQTSVLSASKRAQRSEEAPSMVRMITAEEIRRHGWRALSDALNALPGLHLSYDRSYSYLGVRGFGRPGDYNSRILMLIDGTPLNDGVYDQAPVGTDFPLDLALVDRIEYVPGPGSALYGGNAFFGVINIVTRSGANFRPEMEVGAGSGRALDVRASGGRRDDDGNDWLVSASRSGSRGRDLYFDTYAAPGADAWSRGLDHETVDRVFARYERGGLQARLIASERAKGIPGGPWGMDLNDPRNRDRDRHLHASLGYERQMSPNWRISLQGFAARYEYDERAAYLGIPLSDALENQTLGGEVRLLTTALPAQTLVTGFAWRDDYRRHQFNSTLDVDTPRRSYGLFAQDDWRVNRWLTLSGGVRADRVSANATEAHYSPRLAAIVAFTPATTAKLIAGTAYRPPNGFEADYAFAGTNLANPALRHEQVRNRELGIEHRPGADIRLGVSLYGNRIRDLISLETDAATGLQRHENVGGVSARGVELEGQGRWGGFRFRASMAWQEVTHETGVPLANTPRQIAKFFLSGPLPRGLRFAWETHYLGVRTADSGDVRVSGPSVGGTVVAHAALSGELSRDLSWRVRIGNVFDRRHYAVVGAQYSAAFPGAQIAPMPLMQQDGRTFHTSLTWKF